MSYSVKLHPGGDVDWARDAQVRRAYLDRLEKFVGRLAPDVPSRGKSQDLVQPDLLVTARKAVQGEVALTPPPLRAGRERLHLGLGRQLTRWRGKSGDVHCW